MGWIIFAAIIIVIVIGVAIWLGADIDDFMDF